MRKRNAAIKRNHCGRRSARLHAIAITLILGMVSAAAAPLPRLAVAQGSDTDLSGLTATIAHSEDGVNLRAEPGFAAEVVGTVGDGTVVELRIDVADTVLDPDGQTRWWPISHDGVDAWIAGYYLEQGGAASVSPTGEDSAEAPDAVPGGAITGGSTSAFVTSDDGANLRSDPGIGSDVLAVLPFDTRVTLRIEEADTVVKGGVRWWPVEFDGIAGWVAGDYLADAPGVVGEDDAIPEPPTAVANVFGFGEYVAALTDDGTGLNIRVEAGTEFVRVGVIPEGDIVQVMDGPFAKGESDSGWYLVTDGEVTGYVDGDYLSQASQPPPPAADADPVVEHAELDPVFFASGDVAAATQGGVNVRSGATLHAGLLKTLQTGDVVEVLAGPKYDDEGDGWYLITDGVTTGYANGNFLTVSSAPPPLPAESPAPVAEVAPAPPAAPSPPPPAAGVATGTFIIPVSDYTFTQGYGCSPFAFEPYDANLGCNFHNGLDLANVAYSPVLASDGGVVKYAGWCDCGLGYFVEIDHGNGFSTVYGHMADQPYVVAGQAVAQGDVIGPMGSTGLSTGSHVHFMLKVNGGTVDPLGYLPPV